MGEKMNINIPIPGRYLAAILLSVGLAFVYGLKAHLSVALLFMVNGTAIGAPGLDPCEGRVAKVYTDGPFVWSAWEQGLVLSGYFMGYMLCQWPGARAAETLNSKWLLLASVLVNGVACALVPVVSLFTHYGCLVMLRAVQGFCSGAAFPAVHMMVSRWAPPADHTLMYIIIYSGTAVGTVVATALTGVLAAGVGWQWTFYLSALATLPWCVVWGVFGASSAADAPFLSAVEREYIASTLEELPAWEQSVVKFPCRAAFLSPPFWAILVAHFCSNCGWYALLTQLPNFMKYVEHAEESQIYLFCSVGYFLMWTVAMEVGFLLECLRRSERVSLGVARKVANAFSSLVPAVCCLAMAFMSCSAASVFVITMVYLVSVGALSLGVIANPMDLAPNFGGILIAVTNTVACIPGIFMPIIIGYLLESLHEVPDWQPAFFVMMVVYLIMFVVYTMLGSGKVQPWNSIGDEDTKKPELPEGKK